jgi:hypothetical protein
MMGISKCGAAGLVGAELLRLFSDVICTSLGRATEYSRNTRGIRSSTQKCICSPCTHLSYYSHLPDSGRKLHLSTLSLDCGIQQLHLPVDVQVV